jgi:co-chaperonin GroES (HSP10)
MPQPKFKQAKTAAVAVTETVRPLRDRVLVRPIEVDRHHGLQVVDASRKAIRAEVIAVGPGDYRKKYWLNSQGERCKVGELPGRVPTEVRPGHVVELLAARFMELTIGGERHLMCTEGDIAGIVS